MPVIDPTGLFEGDRLSACSDQARLMWPYLFCISNGYARLEVSLRHIRQKCFSSFQAPPSEQAIAEILREYADNFLILPYESEGRQWVQFDTSQKYLPKHKSKKDQDSPGPTVEELESFNSGYVEWRKKRAETFRTFPKTSAQCPEEHRGIGIGIGSGIEVGVGEGSNGSTEQTNETEADMKATKQIPTLCQAILRTKADMFPSTVAEIQRLESVHKGSAVINAFKEWAEEHVYDELRSPVSAFLKEADDLLGGGSPARAAASDPAVSDLACELTYLSRGICQFDNRQKALLLGHLQKYTTDELIAAFKGYYEGLDKDDSRSRKYAAKTFAETADQLAYAIRRSRQEVRAQAAQIESETERLAREAAAERARLPRVEEEVEETLGGGA